MNDNIRNNGFSYRSIISRYYKTFFNFLFSHFLLIYIYIVNIDKMSRWNIISANDKIHATALWSNYYCMNDTILEPMALVIGCCISRYYKAHVWKSCLENRLSMVLQKLQEKEDTTSCRCPSAFDMQLDHCGSTGNSSRGTPHPAIDYEGLCYWDRHPQLWSEFQHIQRHWYYYRCSISCPHLWSGFQHYCGGMLDDYN